MMTRVDQWARALHLLSRDVPATRLADAFFDHVTERGLSHELSAVIRRLERIADDERRGRTLLIKAAHPLSSESVERVIRFVQADADTPVAFAEDPSVIAGFVAEHRGMIYDASAARQIERLQASLTHTSV